MPSCICSQCANGGCAGRAGPNLAESQRCAEREAHPSMAGRPAELSQLPTSTLRSDSAPHGCQAAVLQAQAGPEHGIGSKSLICTNFFLTPQSGALHARDEEQMFSQPRVSTSQTCSEMASVLLSRGLQPPKDEDGQKGTHMALCLLHQHRWLICGLRKLGTACSTHELRAVLWDRAAI